MIIFCIKYLLIFKYKIINHYNGLNLDIIYKIFSRISNTL